MADKIYSYVKSAENKEKVKKFAGHIVQNFGNVFEGLIPQLGNLASHLKQFCPARNEGQNECRPFFG